MLLGLGPWAPIHQPTDVLEKYLELAEERAGPDAWQRVKGFRFLYQAILDPTKFRELVFSADSIANLKLLGRKGFAFDVGVDQHRAGDWQLEAMSKAIEKAHSGVPENEKVVFIINHLCKPEYEHVFPQNPGALRVAFVEWCDAVTAMAKCSRTYMKFSGQFSEVPTGLGTPEQIAQFIKP